ncbi:hypothetical protein GCM10023257_16510 [Streptomyces hyderabadensis]|uniref:Uncharacterized protein n=1 Tax=Streptomyces hyderabadensis TaxID=598549 RepID=A0ABP9HVR1_9ACTN
MGARGARRKADGEQRSDQRSDRDGHPSLGAHVVPLSDTGLDLTTSGLDHSGGAGPVKGLRTTNRQEAVPIWRDGARAQLVALLV